MRIFFSHAWKSKEHHAVLPRILNQLEDELHLEVWKDNECLDARTTSLEASLADAINVSDAFLLMWSAGARKSPAVAFEITTAIKLGKPMIVCCLDDTKLDHPGLKDPLEIRFYGGRAALMMAHRDLAKAIRGLYEDQMDGETKAQNRDLAVLGGALGDIVARGGPSAGGTERRAYLLRALRKAVAVAEGDEGDEARQIRRLKPLVALYESAGDNPRRLRAVLTEATKLGATDDQLLFLLSLKLREQVQDDLDRAARQPSGQDDGQDRESEAGGAVTSPPDLEEIERGAEGFETAVGEATTVGTDLLEAVFRSALPPVQAREAASLLRDYILAAPEVAKWMVTEAVAGQSAQLVQVAVALIQYWQSPTDLIPDSAGILGKLDDAWLVHTTAEACLKSEWLDSERYPANPGRIAEAGGIAAALLPKSVYSSLTTIVRELVESLEGDWELPAWSCPEAWQGSAGESSPMSTEELREQLSTSIGGLMLKHGV